MRKENLIDRLGDGGDMVSVNAFQWVLNGLHRSWSEGNPMPASSPDQPALCREVLFPGDAVRGGLPEVAPACWGVTEDGGVEIDVRFEQGKGMGKSAEVYVPVKQSGTMECGEGKGSGMEEEEEGYEAPVPPLSVCIMVRLGLERGERCVEGGVRVWIVLIHGVMGMWFREERRRFAGCVCVAGDAVVLKVNVGINEELIEKGLGGVCSFVTYLCDCWVICCELVHGR